MDWWTLVFAAVAAVASIPVVRWGWVDRPQHGWNVHAKWQDPEHGAGEAARDSDLETLGIQVRAVGTAVVHAVQVRTWGARPDQFRYEAAMGVGSAPVELTLRLPRDTTKKVYVEILWTRLRPHKRFGQRIDVRGLFDVPSSRWEDWKWSWRCLRRAGDGWWRCRLVRTEGDWVPGRERPRVDIPEHRPTKGIAPPS